MSFDEIIDRFGKEYDDAACIAEVTSKLGADLALHADVNRLDQKLLLNLRLVYGAHDPKTGRVVVIEINPRTSRSSALASKATGFPIARISSLLAGGLTLDEIPYWRDGTLEKYTPSGEYVVVKFARWAFEKFEGVKDELGTQMRAVGEVMSIGRTWCRNRRAVAPTRPASHR